jgi:Tfp pilus assembly protein PilV
MQIRPERSDDGFSLIEIAIAITSTAILALGVMMVFTTAGVQDRDAYETTRTQNVCASLMEQVEAFTFAELAVFAGGTFGWTEGRWTVQVTVTQIKTDLIAVETRTDVTDDPDDVPVRLVTLKAIKDEVLS